MTFSTRFVIATCCAFVLLSGCNSIPFFRNKDHREDKEPTSTEQQVYNQAQSALRGSNFTEATKQLQDLEARFPFGRYADQAQLDVIYAHFMAFEPEEARAAADRFIRLHPEHPHVDYAYYLKGLAAFNKDRGVLDRILPTSLTRRDPGAARDSFVDFNQLVTEHPESPYAPDARQRMVFLRNLLAASEIEVARYYIRRGALVAAANRGRYVVENYAQAPVVPEALAVMVEAYSRLGQNDLANDALRVLALNYPSYRAFDAHGDFVLQPDIRNQDRSWLNLLSLGAVDGPPKPPPMRVRLPEGAAPMPPPVSTPTATPPKRSGWRRLWPF